ncbi:MAG TPA: nickel pincer cofactor biosynthesis protein LarC [Vicinamibacterales bacterium]
MRIAYFDCFSGLSGDMALGALLDAGLPLADLRAALGGLALGDAHVHAKKVLRTGVSATKFTVHAHKHDHQADQHDQDHPVHHHDQVEHHHDHLEDHHDHAEHHHHLEHHHDHGEHRSLPEIFRLIDQSSLTLSARDRAKGMFRRLAEAEASIHQMPIDRVHLHEVGAIDSIMDIVGIAFAMEWVAADRVVCSPLNVGGGMVNSAHGLFPVPAPATVTLLGSTPIYGGTVQKELVTPTGALIATEFASSFGPIPAMTIERVGYGAGDRDDPLTPNVVRVLIGQAADRAASERVTVVECEIDDMNPQIYGIAMERLYAAGAVEVFYVPVQMKKNRPGTLLSVIVPPDKLASITDVIFKETTTIGLRHYEAERECLAREIVTVETTLGPVRFKVSRRDGRIVTATPEFDDCARLAAANQLAVKDVQRIAIQAYHP